MTEQTTQTELATDSMSSNNEANETEIFGKETEPPTNDQPKLKNKFPGIDSSENISIDLEGSGNIDVSFTQPESSNNEEEASPVSPLPAFPTPSSFNRGESEVGVPRPRVIWRPDTSSPFCANCNRNFTFFLRKHHCRACGHLFCDACSGWRILLPPSFALPSQEKIPSVEEIIPQRVCKQCYTVLSNGGKVVEQPHPSKVPEKTKNMLIIAIGSQEDVKPYVNLANALQKRGHKVTIGSDSSNEELITKNGISFELIPGNLSHALYERKTEAITSQNEKEIIDNHISGWQEAIHESITLNDYEFVILNTVSIYVAISTLESKAELPFIISWSFPSMPTKYYAPPTLTGESDSWFQFLNQIKWRLNSSFAWTSYKDKVNEFRVKLGLLPYAQKRINDVINDMNIPCMNNWSPTVFDHPPDWGDNMEITGQLVSKEIPNYHPSEELKKFLENEGTPIYIGFNESILDVTPEIILNCIQLCCSSVESIRGRTIVCCSDEIASQLKPTMESLGSHTIIINDVCEEWLFPQCKAVFIPGSVGKIMTALRSGVIPIILPTSRDQSFWADLLFRKGYSPQTKSIEKCNQNHITKVLKTATTDEQMWERVQSVSRRMKRENGIERAVEFIERNIDFLPQWPEYLTPVEPTVS